MSTLIINEYGTQEWRVNGVYHRTDGPAVVYPDGDQYWYENGKKHRIDGPAIVYPEGDQYWYVNGMHQVTPKAYQRAANLSDEDMTVLLLKYKFE